MNDREHIRINTGLLLEFFLTFARAEYALKNSGFAKGDERQVSPDWDGFAVSIKKKRRKET